MAKWKRKPDPKVKIVPKISYNKQVTPHPADYLEYYRVVRYWVKVKHGLDLDRFELVGFLYTKRFFTRRKFDQYCNIFSWGKAHFHYLSTNGWVREWRKSTGRHAAVYELSPKGRALMASVYRKLEGREDFSEVLQKNPVLDRSMYTHKVYAMEMKKINLERGKKRRENIKKVTEQRILNRENRTSEGDHS